MDHHIQDNRQDKCNKINSKHHKSPPPDKDYESSKQKQKKTMALAGDNRRLCYNCIF